MSVLPWNFVNKVEYVTVFNRRAFDLVLIEIIGCKTVPFIRLPEYHARTNKPSPHRCWLPSRLSQSNSSRIASFSRASLLLKKLDNDILIKATFLRLGRFHEILGVLSAELKIHVLRLFILAHAHRKDIEIRLRNRAGSPPGDL